jgi:VanZ family protein
MREKLIWRRIQAISVIVIILAGSSVPGKNIPEVFSLTPDKLIHCLEYAVLGFFLFRWLQIEFPAYSLNKISLMTMFSGSLMGIIDENYQRLTPGRTSGFWDWALDTIGVVLSVMLLNFFIKRKALKGK